MKNIVMVVLLCLCMIQCRTSDNRKVLAIQEPSVQEPVGDDEYSRRVLIIYYDAATGKKPLLDAVRSYGAEIIYEYKIINGIAISIPEKKTLKDAITFFEKVKGVLSVNKDRILKLDEQNDLR